MPKKAYGWKRQLPDHRDFKYRFSVDQTLPSSVDLRPLMPPVYDQGQLGSCTANAIAGALQYLQTKENLKWKFTPSRLFIYYNERVMEGTVPYDSGAYIRDGIKSVNSQGVCPEDSNKSWSWPYWTWMYQVKPLPMCYKDALLHESLKYEAVPQTETAIKSVLVDGLPVVFGIAVYESFESQDATKTGDIPMPGKDEKLLGGHAILIVGYDDSKKRFIFRNSWGTGWGNEGYGTLPYGYVLDQNLASDFWAIQLTK